MAVALPTVISSMLLFYRWLTTSTPDGYFLLLLAFYGCCLVAVLPPVGSGTVGKLDQASLLDGVSLYMTFRQLGAALGVAVLTIIVERRQKLHSSRLYEHLSLANNTTSIGLDRTGAYLVTHAGLDVSSSHLASVGLIAHSGAHQVNVLSYADCFLFMALISVIAMCFVPLMAPFVPAPQTNRKEPL
jgi:MFS transporter, DHA2 family, multidrug resistance protein